MRDKEAPMREARGSVGGNLFLAIPANIPLTSLSYLMQGRLSERASPANRRSCQMSIDTFLSLWLVCDRRCVWLHGRIQLVSGLQADESKDRGKKATLAIKKARLPQNAMSTLFFRNQNAARSHRTDAPGYILLLQHTSP
jgi:hypothetical protein